MSPRPTTSTRPQSSPTCSSWTRRRSSPTKSLLRTPTAVLEDMLHQAHRAQAYHSLREDLSVSLSSSSMSDRTGRPVGDRTGRPVEQRNQEAQIRTLLDKQKEQILAECQARLNQHEFQAARAEEVQGQLLQQNLELREAYPRSLTEMEELRKFQNSTFDTIARRKLVEDQNTILVLSGRIQELQNEINCMNDSKEFQDAESIRFGNSHVASRPVSFPPHPIPGGMLRHTFVSPSRREGPPSIWDTHGISGNVFADPLASSSAPCPQELHQWSSRTEEPLHTSTVEKSGRPEQNRDLRCQSGPSAKDSVIFSGRDSLENYGSRPTTTADFGSSLRQIPYTSHVCLLEDKVQDRGMYLFAISYGSDAMDQRSGDG